MAYNKLLSTDEILNVAVQMVERGTDDGLSLRAVALALGVKAPSLYRYFPNKGALELAVAEETLRRMLGELEPARALSAPKARVTAKANTYVRFAREHYALYSYVFQGRVQAAYDSKVGKDLWNTLLEDVSAVTGKPDDTAATVAIWSFLHGYATLQQAGGFGASGPKGGFERGLDSFLCNCHCYPTSSPSKRQANSSGNRRQKR
jgi:AcrR family transcriptional regulator